MIQGCISAHGMVTFTSVKAPLMLNDTYRFLSNLYCRPDDVFVREGLAYVRNTMPNYILHENSVVNWFIVSTLTKYYIDTTIAESKLKDKTVVM